MAFGIFSLKKVYRRQVENVQKNIYNFSSWPEYATKSYYAGGQTTTLGSSAIFRYSFETETFTLIPSIMSIGRISVSASKSSLFGYISGGFFPGQSSRIDRISFATETTGVIINFPTNKTASPAISANLYSYYAGGEINPNGAQVSSIARLSFSDDTISISGNLPTTRRGAVAIESDLYNVGYWAGGSGVPPGTAPSPFFSQIVRLSYETDTINVSGNLPTNRIAFAGIPSRNYGYFAGGVTITGQPTSVISNISRLEYSTGTYSESPSKLLSGAGGCNITGHKNISYGYICYDFLGPTLATSSLMNRLDLSSEVLSSISPGIDGDGGSGTCFSGGQST
jgi:hypothetical protein